jgi:hypothetical protein
MHQFFDDDIIHNNKQGTCMLIDVAIPGVRNVFKKETKKILKYKDLITEIQCMWNVEVKVIPVIILATGTISKSLREYLSNIPGKQEIKELQKQPYWALHTHILWKVHSMTLMIYNKQRYISTRS